MGMLKTNTFFDDWLEEAWQKGIEEGRQEGIEKGAVLAERRLLLLLLEHRFGTVPVRLVLRIDELSADELTRLYDEALDASSPDEIDEAIDDMTG